MATSNATIRTAEMDYRRARIEHQRAAMTEYVALVQALVANPERPDHFARRLEFLCRELEIAPGDLRADLAVRVAEGRPPRRPSRRKRHQLPGPSGARSAAPVAGAPDRR